MITNIKKHFFKFIFILIISAPFAGAHADLVVGAGAAETITDIVLSPWGTESFAISTTASPTNCSATNGWVIFALDNMSSQQAYDRAYALALSAMSSSQPVLVDSSNGTDCSLAYMMAVGALTY